MKAHIQTEINGNLFQAGKMCKVICHEQKSNKNLVKNIDKYSESEILTNESTYCHEQKNNQKSGQKFW